MTGALGNAWSLSPVDVALPEGAFAGGGRRLLRREGRPVLCLTDGRRRPCLHPLWTPDGAVVTAEAPADHPHHSGLWIAADHVHALMPAAGGTEPYTYNFYVDDVFQGRAPGTIRVLGEEATADGEAARIVQEIEWRGPREWAAPEGRVILRERRSFVVRDVEGATEIDVVSEIAAAIAPVELGPTRHALFNVRVADGISVPGTGGPVCSRGRRGGSAITGDGADWVDWSGSVGHGRTAGVALMPAPEANGWWFVSDWGVVTVGPFRTVRLRIAPGAPAVFACRAVVHDGDGEAADIARRHARFVEELGR